MTTRYDILTPATPGAIAILHIHAVSPARLEADLRHAGVSIPPVGGLKVGLIAGVDEGVVARWTPEAIMLMPHGGPAVVEAIARRLNATGLVASPPPDPRATYPEASDGLEAHMLATLARAQSPLAVDVLLNQVAQWRHELTRRALGHITDPSNIPPELGDTARGLVLARLVTPPLVVACGPPNVGKSTLCNALAGRAVSIVADEPGTTRDHVGVTLDLGGLVVRYVDSPGMSGGSPVDGWVGVRPGAGDDERHAVAIAMSVLARADLILRCGDAASGLLDLPGGLVPPAGVVDLALRVDVAPPSFAGEVQVSAIKGRGVAELGEIIRERLVPRQVLERPGLWRYWDQR